MTRLFISYAHDDKEVVRPLATELQNLHYEVWIDIQGLKGGALWGSEIVKAIKKSDFFLLFVSSNSIKSDSVRREVDLAYKHKKVKEIIPLRLEKVAIPAEWDYQTAGIQWIEWGDSDWKKRLLDVLGEPNDYRQLDGKSKLKSRPANENKKQKRIKVKSLDQVEKELRMNKAHWVNAGFSVPAKNFSFTVVYFENQIEAFRNLREEVSGLINQVQIKQINPVYGDFLDRAFDILDRTDTRCVQIQDILDNEEDHPLAITAQKATEHHLACSHNIKELLMQSSVTWTANSGLLDNRLIRLIVEFQILLIASQELGRHLEQIYKLASSSLSVRQD